MKFGNAESFDNNTIRVDAGILDTRGSKMACYGTVAGKRVGTIPGTGEVPLLTLVHEVFHTGHLDLDYLCRWANETYTSDLYPCEWSGFVMRNGDGKQLIR